MKFTEKNPQKQTSPNEKGKKERENVIGIKVV